MYRNNSSFYIKSYQFGHSKLIMESLEDSGSLQIIFDGLEYFEFSRIYKGVELTQLTEQEKIHLFEKRKGLEKLKHCYLKIQSDNQHFLIACLAVKVIVEDKIIYSDYVR